jgi:hypothetical protein
MTRAFVVCLVLTAAVLASCAGAPPPPSPPTARIVVFTASDERIPRNTPVTLLWQAADAGVQDGFASCVVTRRFGNEASETPVQATCAGSVTDAPQAPVTAATVVYRFHVLKQPHDPTDPYLTQTRTVTLDPALYATQAGGPGSANALGVSTVADGGAIVAGHFAGSAAFGPVTLFTSGGVDAFVARTDPDGAWAWATSVAGTGVERALSVSSLTDGGAIVAGQFSATAGFGNDLLTSAGVEDVFAARIEPDGSWAWATRGGGTGTDVATAVGSLVDGGAIVAGYIGANATATFGTDTLASTGSEDVFVARIDPDGAWLWAVRAGGTGPDVALSVSTLVDGGAIVAGSFTGSATFGTTTLTSAGDLDAFVARIGPDGTWTWAARAGGTYADQAFGVDTVADGAAIVTGGVAGTATFGAVTLVGGASDDVFVARIEADGTWAWASRAGGGSSIDQARAVSAVVDGGAIVTGTFTGTATFGPTTLISTATFDTFVARIGADGAW